MYFKIIFKETIIINGRLATDKELDIFEGIHKSSVFKVSEKMSNPQLLEYALRFEDPFIQSKKLRWDTAQIIKW